MSEREKKALDAIIKAFPHMSEFDKGYVRTRLWQEPVHTV